MKDTSVKHTIKDKLLLNATAVSDFKKALRRKHTLRLLGLHLATENHTAIFQLRRGVTKVRNRVKMNHLPLMMALPGLQVRQ